MFLPFLARNSYLEQMEAWGVADHFSQLREQGSFMPLENLQKLAWNLFHWVRRRLHLLGIVDIGTQDGHPVSLRLSRLGASLLSAAPAQSATGARSTLVVNPDFEILLFPESDSPELVHRLDRFSLRTASDRLFRFQLSEDSVRTAIGDGMGISEIISVLSERCRVSLPQNVLFSLRDWGDRAGVLFLEEPRRIVARKAATLARLKAHVRVRELTEEDQGGALRIRETVRIQDFKELLRDLGFHLETLPAKNAASKAAGE